MTFYLRDVLVMGLIVVGIVMSVMHGNVWAAGWAVTSGLLYLASCHMAARVALFQSIITNLVTDPQYHAAAKELTAEARALTKDQR